MNKTVSESISKLESSLERTSSLDDTRLLAIAHSELARTFFAELRDPEMISHYLRAIELQNAVVRSSPNDRHALISLGNLNSHYAFLLNTRFGFDAAIGHLDYLTPLERAFAHWEKADCLPPNHDAFSDFYVVGAQVTRATGLIKQWYYSDDMQLFADQVDATLRELDTARRFAEEATARSPWRIDGPMTVALCEQAMADIYLHTQQARLPVESLSTARQRLDSLTEIFPEHLRLKMQLASLDYDLARAHHASGRLLESEEICNQLSERLRALQTSFPDHRDRVRLLESRVLNLIAENQRKSNRPADAISSLQQALAIDARLKPTLAGSRDFGFVHAVNLQHMGVVTKQSGGIGFQELFHQSRDNLEELVEANPGVTEYRLHLFYSYFQLFQIHYDQGDWPDCQQLLSQMSACAVNRRQHAETAFQNALVAVQLDQPESFLNHLRAFVERAPPSGRTQMLAAREALRYLNKSSSPGADPAKTDTWRMELQLFIVDRLRDASESGVFDSAAAVAELETHEDFAAVRNLPPFQDLIRQLQSRR